MIIKKKFSFLFVASTFVLPLMILSGCGALSLYNRDFRAVADNIITKYKLDREKLLISNCRYGVATSSIGKHFTGVCLMDFRTGSFYFGWADGESSDSAGNQTIENLKNTDYVGFSVVGVSGRNGAVAGTIVKVIDSRSLYQLQLLSKDKIVFLQLIDEDKVKYEDALKALTVTEKPAKFVVEDTYRPNIIIASPN